MSLQTGEDLLTEVLQRNEQRFAKGSSCPKAPQGQPISLHHAVIHGAESVFAKMCGIELVLLEQTELACAAHHNDVSGIIAISGALQASVSLHFERNLIFACSEKFLGTRPTKLDPETIDLVGELTNMVAGSAKERLGQDGLSLSLPTVVAGFEHHVAMGSGMQVSAITFGSPAGCLAINVGIKR